MTGSMRWMRWPEMLILLLMMTGGLSGCTLDGVAARQEKASAYWPELLARQTFGQTFISESANLYRVELATATFDRLNVCTVIFHLRSDLQATRDLAMVTMPCADIQNDRPTEVRFPAQVDSKGKSYYFFMESPDAAPGNAISVMINEVDRYPSGSAYQNGQMARADITFTAYSQENYTFAGVMGSFIEKIGMDPVFGTIHFLLLMIVLGLWIKTMLPLPSTKCDRNTEGEIRKNE